MSITITIIADDLSHAQTILAALSSGGPDLPPPEPEPRAETAAEMQIRVNRQQAAAKARAAKAAKPGPVEAVLPQAGSALGPPEPNGADAPVEEDLGLVDPSMSPGEAKEAGLALIRECYAAGKVAEVKTLQKEWSVAKFYDVPMERGHEFYQRVMKLAVETGIRK